MRALIVRDPWIDLIRLGERTWEIRGTATRVRGRIGLIRSRSGEIVGTADLVDCEGPLDLKALRRHQRRHQIPIADLRAVLERYKRPHALVLENARRLRRPVHYEHPPGAVVWVRVRDIP